MFLCVVIAPACCFSLLCANNVMQVSTTIWHAEDISYVGGPSAWPRMYCTYAVKKKERKKENVVTCVPECRGL